jgi:Cu/Ag efflux pump CusA
MVDGFYNVSYGPGMEGILNYCNEITNTLFSSLFLIFIFVVCVYTLAKSEWKMNSVLTYSFFLIFVSSMIMQLFLRVNPLIVYVSIIGMAISAFV